MLKQLLLLTILLSSCATKTPQGIILGEQQLPVSEPHSATTTATPAAVSTPAAGFVEFVPENYYTTPEQRKFIALAAKKMNEVVHSKCFYDFMSHRKMIQTDGKTPKQVADEFVAAHGKIPVQVYYPRLRSSAVAYRNYPKRTIYINGKISDTWEYVCSLASIFVHESIAHALLNYDHDYEWSPSREYSVPYSANHAFDEEAYSGSNSGACCVE